MNGKTWHLLKSILDIAERERQKSLTQLSITSFFHPISEADSSSSTVSTASSFAASSSRNVGVGVGAGSSKDLEEEEEDIVEISEHDDEYIDEMSVEDEDVGE